MITIEARSKLRVLDLKELYRFRELFFFLVWRDVKVRYKQTLLGALWALLQPLANVVIFTLLFSKIADVPTGGVPYPLFALSALAGWMYTANSVTFASNSLIIDANLIRRVYFPKILLPLANIVSGLADFLVALVALFILLLFYGYIPTERTLLIPLWVLLLLSATAGPALFLAALNALYRDIKYIVPFTMQVWLFITPIAYPLSVIPEKWLFIYALNPLVSVVSLARWIFFDVEIAPSVFTLSVASSLLLLAISLLYFRTVERRFADVI